MNLLGGITGILMQSKLREIKPGLSYGINFDGMNDPGQWEKLRHTKK